ncbi:MAG: 16S rRNA (cytidine(1402)-2'-O)-methyltransferase [Pseudomonadota bacterium]
MAMTEGTGSELFRRVTLEAGLHLVATPIGTARDITLRALDTLASADVLAAEDTRVLRHLMEIHGIPRRDRAVIPYHDHNGTAQRPKLLGLIKEGQSIAYASDAGTPLVADPGFQLARAVIEAGHVVRSVPGPSALLSALSVAGLPTDRFLFAGFPPSAAGARQRWVDEIANVTTTLVIFEAGRRVDDLLGAFCASGQTARSVAICRELTKRFEEIRRGDMVSVRNAISEHPLKGEVVVVLGPRQQEIPTEETVRAALEEALTRQPLKDAAAQVARDMGWRKRTVYQLGLSLKASDRRQEGT